MVGSEQREKLRGRGPGLLLGGAQSWRLVLTLLLWPYPELMDNPRVRGVVSGDTALSGSVL